LGCDSAMSSDEDVNILKGAGVGNLFATKMVRRHTSAVADKWRAKRPKYEPVDLKRWLTEEEIAKGLSLMGEGARSIAKRRV